MDFLEMNVRALFLRELLARSAREMSAAVGLSSSMWAYLESGEKSDPRVSTPKKIAERLALEFTWVATGKGPMVLKHPELDPTNKDHHEAIRTHLLKALEVRPAKRRPATAKTAPKRKAA